MRHYRSRGRVIILILLSAALLPLTAQDGPDTPGSINAQGSRKAEDGAVVGTSRLNSLQPAEAASFFDTAVPLLMDKSAIAGTTVSVVKDGSIILQKGYGYAQVETGEPVQPDRTLFRIGSVTKLFIWTAVMQLIENGKLSLDDPIDTRIDFTIPNPWDTPITIRQLMTHTAGFEDQGFGMWAADSESLIPSAEWIQKHIPTVVRQPGSEAAYSNYGAALAAYIVELASGLDFNTYIEQHMFLPLGMQHTTNRQPLPEHLEADMSDGYIRQNGKYIAQPFELLNLSPAGAASSTAADMALFMLDMLNDESRLLSRETRTLMHQQAFLHDPRLENGMALGFYETAEQGIRILGHGGDTLLFHSRLALFPEYDLGIFVSTNSAGGSELGTELISAFLDRFTPTDRLMPTDRSATTELTAERESESGSGSGDGIDISKAAGEYRMNRMSYTTPEKLYQTLAGLTLSAGPDGTVLINGYKGPEMYLPLNASHF
jgi:CubicO group peptidase (beta-lactamase class C family)